jgi:ferritin-like metal-binding protein YciE
MATVNERLMQWLLDARAMEREAEVMLAALDQHIRNYPEVQAEAKRVLRETREQADVIQDSIERRGGDTSKLEVGRPAAKDQSLSGAFVGTKATKSAMTKLSGYNIIIAAAADAAGDSETRAVCDEILRKEEAMAQWLKNYVTSVTGEYLGHEKSFRDVEESLRDVDVSKFFKR